MITIVDYGVGNLFSLESGLSSLGLSSEVTGDAERVSRAERIILPGVGAFGDAMRKLNEKGLSTALQSAARARIPILGICLGMQLLFEESHEFGLHEGLGLIPGAVAPLENDLREKGFDYKVPHMGWNPLTIKRRDCPLLKYIKDGTHVYYVHSFYAKNCDRFIAAQSEYGVLTPGLVWNGGVFGSQFHPEKSGTPGLTILKAFAEAVL
ncbi:MAG: imidazole glycerol phosphate synthase subunit HisH [Clostridiales bacterium]|jgi:glutamine amidotransferase|nr:imidazole glycerol phosphate synthase subunit HisH [Clostridiales bacterium]